MTTLTEDHLKRMYIPRVHWGARVALIHGEHREKIVQYVDNIVENIGVPKGLLLFGKNSSGKSAIAAIILKAAACHGFLGFWLIHRKLPEYEVEKTPFDEDQTIIERARTCPILVLDELLIRDTVRGTETMAEGLIRERVDRQLCTVITTNLTPDVVKAKYRELAAALMECVVPLKVDGKDYRAEKQRKLCQTR